MAIAERQLETWSRPGSTGEFTDTYNAIRRHLLDTGAPYPVSDVEVFLQGSYANTTNVHGDSDVDIVLMHNAAYFFDIDRLPADQQARYHNARIGPPTYGHDQFKADAQAYIQRLYNGVRVGTKAIHIPGNNGRRNADILVCQELRRYESFGVGNNQYHEGVRFYFGNTCTDNHPKLHLANCTAKHQATNGNFKPMVRVFKNMRNTLIENDLLAEGIAPSYFIEGMLWNVPNECFAGDFGSNWVDCFNWLNQTDETQLACANGLYWLIRENSSVCWPSANFRTFMNALRNYWES